MKALKSLISTEGKAQKATTPSVSNPYLNAKRAWNVHTAGIMKSLQIWQFVGLSCLLIAVTAVSGVIYIGSQSKYIPLVFQQDASGNTLSVTRGDRVTPANIEDFRTTAARFIENLRMVSIDQHLQKKAVFQVYSYLNQNDAALAKVSEFYSGATKSNPFERASKETVSIEIRSVLQESPNSWQVDWVETVRNLDGTVKSLPIKMKALLTLYQEDGISESSPESLLKNPHFIYVRDFNWSEELKTGATS